MPSSLRWRAPLALLAVAIAAWYALPLEKRINLGLDLQGGMHLVLKVDLDKISAEARGKDVTGIALEVIRNRIDQFGVREPLIQRQGTDHILVQLPGITDRERALALIGQTALLEFQLVADNPRLLQQALDGAPPRGFRVAEDETGTPLLLDTESTLTGTILSDADVAAGDYGLPIVRFWMNKEGAKAFGRLTGANVGKRLAIVLDGKVQSAPVVQSRITDEGQITGDFTREQANDLAIVLRAGSLPAPISIEEERTVGPTLGADSIRAGITATGVGAALIVAFMLVYYLTAGFIAVLALLLNVLLILGGMGYFGATLTLPGIAGIILTLGMAVDANVLIYERMREELKAGRPLGLAIDAGYGKAFSAILDSNLTTVIAAVFLYYFGTGAIRGFATTLIIGLMASMFTAIFVTRIIFDLLLGAGVLSKLPMLKLIGETKIDFIAKRHLAYVFSIILVGVSIAGFVMPGDQKYGLDFTGGLLQEYRFAQAVDANRIRASLQKVGKGDAILQQFGAPNEWLIRSADDTEAEITQTTALTREALGSDFAEAAPQLVRLERVGPTVGAILRQKAWLAIAWSMVGILLYVAFRFRHWDFGIAGVLALTHDVVVAGGLLCLLGKQIDFITVSALMTIAGFSINDTIVIYDRVRENLRLHRRMSVAEAINLSVNETLGRTILTSLTVIFSVLALYLFGGPVLRDFSICLLIGFFSGVYSTVYIASSFVITWQRLFSPKKA